MIDDPYANVDELIEGYFADEKILAADTARHRADHTPIPADPLPGYDGRLFDWLTEMLGYGPPDGPERAWPIVLELVTRAPDDRALTFVGCGAIEDLVLNAGDQFADRITEQARTNPRFRRALCHAWYTADVPAVLKNLIEESRLLEYP